MFQIMKSQQKKVILLFSGGLDSVLAAFILKEQNLDVLCLHFILPFSDGDSKARSERGAKEIAEKYSLNIITEKLGEDYLEVIKAPNFGYGKHMNSCIDCKIYMLKYAVSMMPEVGADFIATGEVLGQRPMSQRISAMKLLEKETGLSGLILRPLCAKLLDPTIPETEGWVGRARLLSIAGRSREKQFELMKKFNIDGNYYQTPSGGCKLTMRE
jgi:tRNA U34 2-thiouridine synthase MnmA/TrmU